MQCHVMYCKFLRCAVMSSSVMLCDLMSRSVIVYFLVYVQAFCLVCELFDVWNAWDIGDVFCCTGRMYSLAWYVDATKDERFLFSDALYVLINVTQAQSHTRTRPDISSGRTKHVPGPCIPEPAPQQPTGRSSIEPPSDTMNQTKSSRANTFLPQTRNPQPEPETGPHHTPGPNPMSNLNPYNPTREHLATEPEPEPKPEPKPEPFLDPLQPNPNARALRDHPGYFLLPGASQHCMLSCRRLCQCVLSQPVAQTCKEKEHRSKWTIVGAVTAVTRSHKSGAAPNMPRTTVCYAIYRPHLPKVLQDRQAFNILKCKFNFSTVLCTFCWQFSQMEPQNRGNRDPTPATPEPHDLKNMKHIFPSWIFVWGNRSCIIDDSSMIRWNIHCIFFMPWGHDNMISP